MSKRSEDNTSGASEKRVMKVENNNWIPLFSRKSLWVFLCVAGFFGGGMSCQLQAASDSPAIADWVERQVWFVNLAGSMPRGVGLLILPETEEKESGWESFSLRETHSENSGFDPSVSPLVGIFRVSPDRGMIEWMDPVSGDWQSIAAFLRSRSADDTKSADGEPASMPGKQSTSDDSKAILVNSEETSMEMGTKNASVGSRLILRKGTPIFPSWWSITKNTCSGPAQWKKASKIPTSISSLTSDPRFPSC